MKLTKIGLLSLGLISLTQANIYVNGGLAQVKQSPFSPKIEIRNNLTTIIPQDNTVVEEGRGDFDTKARNVTNYLLPKINNGKISINNDTKIHLCGEKTYLIALGVNKYKYVDMKLQQAVNDAKKIVKKITSNCKNTETYLLLNKEATKENILKTLESISKKATKKDSIIFFYSGNGFNYNHQNYLVAYDSVMNKQMPKINSFISTKSISSLFKAQQIKKGLMLFDACTTTINPYK
jgi:hypothetical protein